MEKSGRQEELRKEALAYVTKQLAAHAPVTEYDVQQRLIRGYVLNKFRGEERLLAPGPQRLEQLTGVRTLGVLPMWREHGLPEEDGVFDAESTGSGLSIVILAYPRISNRDEFGPLRGLANVSVSWARRPDTLGRADLLILPGSKHVAEDLAWLRAERRDRHSRLGGLACSSDKRVASGSLPT